MKWVISCEQYGLPPIAPFRQKENMLKNMTIISFIFKNMTII